MCDQEILSYVRLAELARAAAGRQLSERAHELSAWRAAVASGANYFFSLR